MLRFNPNTLVKFYYKVTDYVSGKGNTTTWEKITSDGHDAFYCEWKGAYGDRALSAEALGVKESATIRTFYNPNIYKQLRSVQVIVIKNGIEEAIVDGVPDKSNPNVYELWGGVDNVLEENKYMEFRVRRYEGI